MSREGEDDHLSESSGSEDEKEDPSIDKLCAIVVFDEEMTPSKHVFQTWLKSVIFIMHE